MRNVKAVQELLIGSPVKVRHRRREWEYKSAKRSQVCGNFPSGSLSFLQEKGPFQVEQAFLMGAEDIACRLRAYLLPFLSCKRHVQGIPSKDTGKNAEKGVVR